MKENKVLFPSDAFGQLQAGYEKFDDPADENAIMDHAKRYHATIILPFSLQAEKQVNRNSNKK